MSAFLILAIAAAIVGCDDDDDDDDFDDDGFDDVPTAFTLRIENVAPFTVLKSGTVGTAPLAPGESISIVFTGGRGHAITFASMLGESNDWFFAPGPEGIPLFDERGAPISGDVTAYVKLWDAGTECDQELGVGDATAVRQPMPNFGEPDPIRLVREVPIGSAPAVAAMLRATLAPGEGREFTLTITNVSTAGTLVTSAGAMAIHLSPIAWAMHQIPAPLFAVNQPDRGLGLERVAEDGNPQPLGTSLAATTGIHTPLSPGVFVVHRDPNRLFEVGAPDYGLGLERIAEDGDPAQLNAALAGEGSTENLFAVPVGAAAPLGATPGNAYEFVVLGVPGDHVTFATMFGMSNDWFFAPGAGIALFANGTPRAGDVTGEVALYDLGTEADEELAIGPSTGLQQPLPNTGAIDPDRNVRDAPYAVPVATHLRVTLTPR
jgi:hypothetical protein